MAVGAALRRQLFITLDRVVGGISDVVTLSNRALHPLRFATLWHSAHRDLSSVGSTYALDDNGFTVRDSQIFSS